MSLPRWALLAVICMLTISAYAPTLTGSFLLDDNGLIKNNPYIKKWHALGSYLLQEDGVTDPGDEAPYHTGYYRPLINITYTLDYHLFGMAPSGFRATNLCLHLVVVGLLFCLLERLIGDRYAALYATLFFALHPAGTEAVAWVSSRNNLLVTLFSLLAFHLHLRHAENPRRLYPFAAAGCLVLALLSKEFALMMVPILWIYDRVGKRESDTIKEMGIRFGPLALATAGYLLLRQSAIGTWPGSESGPGLWERLTFLPFVAGFNLRLVLLPWELHSFIVGYPPSFFHWQSLACIGTLSACGMLLWRFRGKPLLTFSFLAFFLALFPVLQVIPTSAVTVASLRWLYFPMAFAAVGAAEGLKGRLSCPRGRGLLLGVVMTLLAYGGVYTFILNATLWYDEETFFRQEVLRFGNLYYAGGLAEQLLDKKAYSESEKQFKAALAAYPKVARIRINYAALLLETNRPTAALDQLVQAAALPMTRKERAEWHANRGMARFLMKQSDLAVAELEEALRHDTSNPRIWSNLGVAHAAAGRKEEALRVLLEGLEMTAGSVALRKNLARVYLDLGRPKEALRALEEIDRGQWSARGITRLYRRAQEALSRSQPAGPEAGGGVRR